MDRTHKLRALLRRYVRGRSRRHAGLASNANVVVRFPGQARTYGASLTFNF